MSPKITVACPHCDATLEVDVDAAVVVSHKAPVHVHEKADFDARLRQIEEDRARASDRMAEAMRKEKSKDRIMADRFQKLMEDAKRSPDDAPPIKDVDL